MSPSELLTKLHAFNARPRDELASLTDDELAALYKTISDAFWALGHERTIRRLELRKVLARIMGTPEFKDRADQADIDEFREENSLGGQRYRGR